LNNDTSESAEGGRKSAKFLAEARECIRRAKSEEALRCALQGLKHTPTPVESADLNRIAGEALLNRGQLNEAFDYVTIARRYALTCGDSEVLCKSVLALGNVYARMNRYALADKAWSEALTLANINGDVRLQGRILVNKAIISQRYGDHDQAIVILEDARRRLEKVGDLHGLAGCYDCIVSSYTEKDEPKLAMRSFEKLEELARQLDDKRLDAITQFRRGALHLKQDEFTEALEPLEEAYRLFKGLGDRKNRAIVLCNLIRVHIGLKQIGKVGPLLKQAIGLAKGVDSASLMSNIQMVRGEMAVYEGAGNRAIRYFTEALSYAEKADDVERFRSLHGRLGEMVKELGFKVPGLEQFLKRARRAYSSVGLKNELAELDEWLKQVPSSDVEEDKNI
jgi:tetratricopeptide (TPR) repeat protein